MCGYLVALVFTPLTALLLIRLRVSSDLLARLLPPGVSAISVGVLLHGTMFLFWTGAGILLGLVLLAMEGSGGAFGSRNAAFSLFVFALTLALAAPVALLLPAARRATVLGGLAVLLLFGWLMPYMAEWTKFD